MGGPSKVEGSSTSTPASSFGTLSLKKKQKLQAWQAYHLLTYETQWKPVIDKEWAELCTEWEKLHPDEKIPQTWFAFMNKFMKEKFDKETDKVKKQVEEYQQKAIEEKAENLNAVYQQ